MSSTNVQDAITEINSSLANKVTTGTFTFDVTTIASGNIYADTRDRTGLVIPKPDQTSVLLGAVINPETPYNQTFWVGRLITTGTTVDRLFIFSTNAINNVSCTFRYFAFWA